MLRRSNECKHAVDIVCAAAQGKEIQIMQIEAARRDLLKLIERYDEEVRIRLKRDQ